MGLFEDNGVKNKGSVAVYLSSVQLTECNGYKSVSF